MGTYVSSSAEVEAHIPYRTIGASTKPSTTTVEGWITRAEAQLTGALRAASITTPITDTEGIQVVKTWLLMYLVGLVEKALASAGGDPDNDSGIDAIEAWNSLLNDIQKRRAIYEAMLCAAASDNTRKLRGHAVDGGYSSSQLAPRFTREDWGDQF